MFLTCSALAVVETPATIVSQDQFWSEAFERMIGHKKSIPNCVSVPKIYVCHECILPKLNKQNINKKNVSSKKIIERSISRLLANLDSNGYDDL